MKNQGTDFIGKKLRTKSFSALKGRNILALGNALGDFFIAEYYFKIYIYSVRKKYFWYTCIVVRLLQNHSP
jgi:hypothetical protein